MHNQRTNQDATGMIKSMTGGPVDEVGDEVVQISVPEKGCRILDRTNHKTFRTPGVGNCYVEAHVDPYELADSDDGELFAVRILVVFSTTWFMHDL